MQPIMFHALADAAGNGPQRSMSRRGLLARSTRVAGGGALALAFSGAAVGRAEANSATDQSLSDLGILQELLRLEHLESSMYREALWRFSGDEETGDRLLPTHPTLAAIAAEEGRHVARLKQAISDFGVTPVAAAKQYDFGYDDFRGFLRLAAEVEDAVVTAHVGSMPDLAGPAARAMVAGMLAAEARHAAYFAHQAGAPPFAETGGAPRSRAEVVAHAAQFATS